LFKVLAAIQNLIYSLILEALSFSFHVDADWTWEHCFIMISWRNALVDNSGKINKIAE
jgi:hypothetical protein